MFRTPGGTRTRTSVSSQDFLTNYGFRHFQNFFGICGLDFLFILFQMTLKLRYRLLSLYTFPDFNIWTWLGIANFQHFEKEGFPEFKRFYIDCFQSSTQIFDVLCSF